MLYIYKLYVHKETMCEWKRDERGGGIIICIKVQEKIYFLLDLPEESVSSSAETAGAMSRTTMLQASLTSGLGSTARWCAWDNSGVVCVHIGMFLTHSSSNTCSSVQRSRGLGLRIRFIIGLDSRGNILNSFSAPRVDGVTKFLYDWSFSGRGKRQGKRRIDMQINTIAQDHRSVRRAS